MNRPDWGLERCITCYMCLAACPVYKSYPTLFLGPTGFVKLGNMHFNPVDKADRVQMATQGGVHLCESYGACQEVCPQKIRIVPIIRVLTNEAEKRDLSDNYGIRTKLTNEMTRGFI
jgi:succinate dehydrogenase/fumarate reductase-like Fe-S protein